MSVILRSSLFSTLRNASRSIPLFQRKALTSIRLTATAPIALRSQKFQQLNVSECMLILENEISRRGRLSGFELEYILQALAGKGTLKSDQILLLIRCCGSITTSESPEDRMKYLNEVWKSVKESGVTLDISHYNSFLIAQIENEQNISSSDFLDFLNKEGVAPNRITYQYLLSSCCQNGNLAEATSILEEMKRLNFPLNEHAFNALVMGHCAANDFAGAKDVMEIMRQKQVLITSKTYSMLLCGLAISGNIEQMKSVVNECAEQNIELKGNKLMDIIYYLFMNGHDDYAVELLQKNGKPSRVADLAALQYRLLHKGRFEAYLQTLDQMPDNPIDIKMKLANRFLGNKASLDDIHKFNDACQKNGVELDVYHSILYYALMSNDSDKAFRILEHLHKSGYEIKISYFIPLLRQASLKQDMEYILTIINVMICNYNLKLQPIHIANSIFNSIKFDAGRLVQFIEALNMHIPQYLVLNSFFISCLKTNNRKNLEYILNRYKTPIRLNLHLMDAMVDYLHNHNNLKTVTSLLVKWYRERMNYLSQEKKMSQDYKYHRENIQKFIDELALKVFHKRDKIRVDFFNMMIQEKIPLSATAIDSIEKDLKDDELKSIIAQMRQMEYRPEEIEESEHTQESVSGDEAHKSSPSSLRLAGLEDINEIERLFNENEDLQDHFGFRTVVQCLKNLNEDEKIKKYLRRYYEKFSQFSDLPRNVYLESEMINQGMLKEAITLVGKRRFYGASFHILMNLFRPIFEKGDVDEIKETFNFEPKPGCKAIDIQIVIDYLANSGLHETIWKMIRSFPVEDLKQIHLAEHVIPSLHNKKNFEIMENLIGFIEKDFPFRNSASDLLFLYACTGKIEKGRELLDKNKQFTFEWFNIASALDGGVQVLENAAGILKGQDIFAKTKLYELIMVLYDQNSVAADKGLDLWLQLQEENIHPSSRFLTALANILKKNGKDIPFEVPQSSFEEIVIPRNLPQIVGDAVRQINPEVSKSMNNGILLPLILRNRLQKQHIESIFSANVNMNRNLKDILDSALFYIEWRDAYKKNEIVKRLNSVFEENSGKKALQHIPHRLLAKLFLNTQGNIGHFAAKVILKAHLENFPEYKNFVNFLEEDTINNINGKKLSSVLDICESEKTNPKLRQALSTLMNKNVFLRYEDLQKRAENILNVRGNEESGEKQALSSPGTDVETPTTEEDPDADWPAEKTEDPEVSEEKTRTSGSGPNI